MQTTKLILNQLVFNEDYIRTVFPYLKENYFSDPKDALLFKLIKQYFEKYNQLPNPQILQISLENSNAKDTLFADTGQLIKELREDPQELQWLIDTTEAFCKEQAIFNGLHASLAILKDNKKEKGQVVKILEDAISISFDDRVGHDYIEDFDKRFDYYHKVESKISFDIDILNEITEGGLPDKTLTIIMGGIHVGKTLTLCHMAAANLLMGKNVLYITMEMSEDEIGKRIDANLLDVELPNIKMMPRHIYDEKAKKLKGRTAGRLIVKEYPTASASVIHIRHLLHELRFKKKFVPQIIYLDYLNIFASSRLRLSSRVGLYQYVQAIVEEVRGLAVEQSCPIVTATQLNREGFESSDPGMQHTAESFAVPATADLILLIIVSEDLKKLGQVAWKQEKNRLGDISRHTQFLTGRDVLKQRLYNLEGAAHRLDARTPMTVNTTAEKFDKRKLFEEFK